MSLNTGGDSALARPYLGNLKTGAFEPTGEPAARVHADCVGRLGRGDVMWMADDGDAGA